METHDGDDLNGAGWTGLSEEQRAAERQGNKLRQKLVAAEISNASDYDLEDWEPYSPAWTAFIKIGLSLLVWAAVILGIYGIWSLIA